LTQTENKPKTHVWNIWWRL